MADLSQADRKQKEARSVAWLGRAIGISSLGMTGVLSLAAAIQGPDSLLFQPTHARAVANYESSAPVTEVVIEVPVPSPLPPTHVPASASGAGGNWQPVAGAPPATVVHVGVSASLPLPPPVATSSGSVPH
jgi:hypothetical protein